MKGSISGFNTGTTSKRKKHKFSKCKNTSKHNNTLQCTGTTPSSFVNQWTIWEIYEKSKKNTEP